MKQDTQKLRVLYSYPHSLGADRICYTAWQQVRGLTVAGADVLVLAGSLARPVPEGAKVLRTTRLRGKLRCLYNVMSKSQEFALHDYNVSRELKRLVGKVDIIHTWPRASLRTLKTAARLGIPTVLERCNAHSRFAFEVVRTECQRLGVALPPGHEHAFNEDVLRVEKEEYRLAYRLLCPSDFVVQTFREHGFAPEKLARHIYGYDETTYYPPSGSKTEGQGLHMLFVGVCAVRKGLHYALEAWLNSPAHREGTFTIAGAFLPAYQDKLKAMLSHPSVRVLGHRNDVPNLMRKSDILVLPSIEEGSALATLEARGSGCVLLVSEASGAICKHMENALVHSAGDVPALGQHMTMLHEDRALLERLRTQSLRTLRDITWAAAGRKLLDVYGETIAMYEQQSVAVSCGHLHSQFVQ